MKRWLITLALLAFAIPAFAGWQSRDSNYNQNIVAGGGSTTTWNPADKNANMNLSGGDLTAARAAGTGDSGVRAIASASTGKKYWEVTINTLVSTGGDFAPAGIANSTWNLTFIGASGSAGFTGSSGFVAGEVACVAVDLDARKLWARRNGGSWQPSGDPAAGTGGTDISAITGALFAAVFQKNGGDSMTANFGGSAYSQTPPSGYGNW